MDPRLRLQDLGAAAITLAPTTPSDLLAALGVSNPQPLEDVAAALREHYDDAWFMEQYPASERQPPMLAACQISRQWSAAVEIFGATGWVGCTPRLLRALSERHGFACTAYFDQEDAKIFLCDQGGDIAQIDATTGNRIGTINAGNEARLAQAGFPPGGFPAMSLEMKELAYVGRLGAAFAAVTQYTLEDCLAGSSWIGGLAQR
jgi:hypothetical protein